MNIQNEFKLVLNHASFLFKENMTSNLTTLEKKIFFVASLAIGLIALCFYHFIAKDWSNKPAVDETYSKAYADAAKAKKETVKYQEEAIKAKNEVIKYQEEAIKAKNEAAKFRKEAEKVKTKADQAKNKALDEIESSKAENDELADNEVEVQDLKIQISKFKSDAREAENNAAAIKKVYKNEILQAQKKEHALIRKIKNLEDAKIKAEEDAAQAKEQAAKFKAEVEALKKMNVKEVIKPKKQTKNDPKAVKKHAFKIINAPDYKGSDFEEQINKIDKTSNSLYREWKLQKESFVLLAVKDDRTIVGYISGDDSVDNSDVKILNAVVASTTFASQEDAEVETQLMLETMKRAKSYGINHFSGKFEYLNPNSDERQAKMDFCGSFSKFHIKVKTIGSWNKSTWCLELDFDLTNFKAP